MSRIQLSGTVIRAMAKTTHPVQVLRDHAVELQAAMDATLRKPKKSVVHKLRSQTRRLEAQLELLQALEAVPEHSEEAGAVRRRLDKLRRLAGRVRDLDVQRKLLREFEGLPPEAAKELRGELKQEREHRAAKLQRALGKQLPKIASALDAMVQSVSAANGLVLPDVRLVPVIERWRQSHEDIAGDAAKLDDEQLHSARKAAKSARYMAESAAGSAAALKAAAKYEKQQDAGGRWHDWLELAETAKDHFGKKHALTRAAKAQCEVARAEYVTLLD